jgi:hypothetical protein
MADYAAKLTATASSVLDGERFVAAMKCFPQGHSKKKMGGAVFGAIGAARVAKGKKEDHAMGGELLPLELALGLTDTRGFVFALSTLTGKAKLPPLRVVPREFIASVASRPGRTVHVKHTLIWLRLTDGSDLALETAQYHAANGEQFVTELRRTAKTFDAPENAMTSMGPSVAAWAPDPSTRHQLRYWDGQRWTEHVSDDGATGIDPLEDDTASR